MAQNFLEDSLRNGLPIPMDDKTLLVLLLLLLTKENADQGLLLALLYILV